MKEHGHSVTGTDYDINREVYTWCGEKGDESRSLRIAQFILEEMIL
jgi:hypothetical protein